MRSASGSGRGGPSITAGIAAPTLTTPACFPLIEIDRAVSIQNFECPRIGGFFGVHGNDQTAPAQPLGIRISILCRQEQALQFLPEAAIIGRHRRIGSAVTGYANLLARKAGRHQVRYRCVCRGPCVDKRWRCFECRRYRDRYQTCPSPSTSAGQKRTALKRPARARLPCTADAGNAGGLRANGVAAGAMSPCRC